MCEFIKQGGMRLSFLSYLSHIASTSSTMISLGFFKFGVVVRVSSTVRKFLIPQFFFHILFALCLSTPLPPLLFPYIHWKLLTIV